MKATNCLAVVLCFAQMIFAQLPDQLSVLTYKLGKAPRVYLSHPTEGLTFDTLVPISLSAIAYDPDKGLDRVEFWVNNQMVGADDTIPYCFDWQPKDYGIYHIKATAFDTAGNASDSNTHSIRIHPPDQNSDSSFNNEIPAEIPIFYDYPAHIKIELDIKISPNPVRGGMIRVELHTPLKKELAQISIINSDGRLLLLRELLLIESNTTTIDVSKLSPGTYYAVVSLRDDVHSERFVLMGD